MSWNRLRRLLSPQPLATVSADPEDPRLGDLLRSADHLEGAEGSTCVILGVPQHLGVERNGGRPGAAEGPTAIRSWLRRMATSAIVDAVRHRQLTVIDAGDLYTEGKTLQQIHDEQHDAVLEILEHGMIPIVLGGGHDIAWPTIRAMDAVADVHGTSFGVVNIDAHADVRPLKDGGLAHSGSPFRQMLETDISNLAAGAFLEVGLQHHAVAAAHVHYVRDHGHTVMMLHDIRQEGILSAWNAVTNTLDRADQWYVSLDLDGFASAFAPGVSAPSADGFAPWEVGPALRSLAARQQFSAFDVVEMNPTFDVDGRTAKLAATMIMDVLAGVASRGS